VASIGLASGGGMYVESAAVTALGLGALTVMRRLERKEDNQLRGKLSLVLKPPASSLPSIVTALQALGVGVSQNDYENDRGQGRVVVTFHIRRPTSVSTERVMSAIVDHPEVERARIEAT
jgi:uncharacterized membrane protein YhiD involved in acid resistance